jgi:CRP/FNR family transcriptional regulator
MQRLASTAEERAEALAACPLFADLSAADLRALAGVAVRRGYEKGETLFLQGRPAEGFFLPVAGRVRVSRYSAEGREQVLHLFGPGEPVGEVPVFEGGAYPATATAQEALESLYLPREGFRRLAGESPELLLRLLGCLAGRLRHFVELVDDLALKEVAARLARHLLVLSAAAGEADRVELESSKAVLAARLGTLAETLSRTLGRLQERGLVAVDGRRIELRDRRALADLAAGVEPA